MHSPTQQLSHASDLVRDRKSQDESHKTKKFLSQGDNTPRTLPTFRGAGKDGGQLPHVCRSFWRGIPRANLLIGAPMTPNYYHVCSPTHVFFFRIGSCRDTLRTPEQQLGLSVGPAHNREGIAFAWINDLVSYCHQPSTSHTSPSDTARCPAHASRPAPPTPS